MAKAFVDFLKILNNSFDCQKVWSRKRRKIEVEQVFPDEKLILNGLKSRGRQLIKKFALPDVFQQNFDQIHVTDDQPRIFDWH